MQNPNNIGSRIAVVLAALILLAGASDSSGLQTLENSTTTTVIPTVVSLGKSMESDEKMNTHLYVTSLPDSESSNGSAKAQGSVTRMRLNVSALEYIFL